MISKLASYIVKPKRSSYNPNKDLGPPLFFIEGFPCSRIDFQVINDRGLTLQGSIYHPSLSPFKKKARYACIIYCHGNCGNRTDGFETLKAMLSKKICVVCFDFAGCGLSEGSFVTLGYNESKDIECVIDHVRFEFKFVDPDRIGLWGRSMGAVSSLLYASRRKDVNCIVLDSPFCDLSVLIEECVKRYKLIAKVAGKYILRKLKENIEKITGIEVDQLRPIDHVSNLTCPVVFVHSKKDELINIKHSRILFERVVGEKLFLETEVGHNDLRPQHIYSQIKDFVFEKLHSIKEVSPSQQESKAFAYFSSRENPKLTNLLCSNSPTKNELPSEMSMKKSLGLPKFGLKNEVSSRCATEGVSIEETKISIENAPDINSKGIMTTRVTLNYSSRRGPIQQDEMLALTSRNEASFLNRDDESSMISSEEGFGFGRNTPKIKDSERFDVFVQSPHSIEVTNMQRRFKLHLHMEPIINSKNNSEARKLSKSSIQTSNKLQELRQLHDDNQFRQLTPPNSEMNDAILEKKTVITFEPSQRSQICTNFLPKIENKQFQPVVKGRYSENKYLSGPINAPKLKPDKRRIYPLVMLEQNAKTERAPVLARIFKNKP